MYCCRAHLWSHIMSSEEFVSPTSNILEVSTDDVAQLKSTMRQIPSTAVRRHPQRATYVNQALETCTHVLVRHDAVRKPLQQPYDSAYKVVKRADKYYTLDVNGPQSTVTLNHLKPAYLEQPASTDSAQTVPSRSSILLCPIPASPPTCY